MAQTDTIRTSGKNELRSVSLSDIGVVVSVTLICAIALRMFVLEAYRIPSASMENTLRRGDMILVNKLAYGVRVPSAIPFMPVSLSSGYILPLSNIRRGDVIVFELPGLARNDDGFHATYVKRCIGLPGDTVEVRSSRIYVNGREMIPPPTFRTPRFAHTSLGSRIFPKDAGFTLWEYGPIRVPRAGDRIELTAQTLSQWQRVIEREGRRVDMNGRSILIDGIAQDFYTLRRDYYFVLGDHLDNSTDSRAWGFVCEDDVVGEALLVYWSSAPFDSFQATTGPFRDIRWERIGSLIR